MEFYGFKPLPSEVAAANEGSAPLTGEEEKTPAASSFYSMLRSGELISLRSSHILVSQKERQALISLGYTRGQAPRRSGKCCSCCCSCFWFGETMERDCFPYNSLGFLPSYVEKPLQQMSGGLGVISVWISTILPPKGRSNMVVFKTSKSGPYPCPREVAGPKDCKDILK